MKKLITLLACLLLASCAATPALAEGNSLIITQRNAADTGNILRTILNPPTDGILIWNKSTLLPSYLTIGPGLVSSNGVLSAVPSSFTQANADWNATSGAALILNKPAIKTVAITGQAGDLTGLAPVALSGAWADISGRPVIPAAQVNSDWAASTGVSAILNKPTFAAVATSGSYNDLTNKPAIPATYTFDYGDPLPRTLAFSAAYQALTPAKAANITISPSCTAALNLTGGGTCTLQVRTSPTAGLTCSNGTLYGVWSNANTAGLSVSLALNNKIGNPATISLRAGAYFIMCPTAGTFTLDAAVDQTVG